MLYGGDGSSRGLAGTRSPDWIHEVKYDDGKDVQLLSRSGLDWTWRFPWIAETALKIRHRQFVIDGEICVLDVQGISDFNALHSNKYNDEARALRLRPICLRRRGLAGPAITRPQGPARQAAARPGTGDLRGAIRARRDRTGSVHRGVPDAAGGDRLKAPAAAREDLRLDQGQEPAAPGIRPRCGSVLSQHAGWRRVEAAPVS
jgi:hypothetical protein